MNIDVIALLNNELNIFPIEVTRFTTGYCHSVFYIKTDDDEYVIRITGEGNKNFYSGSVKWLNELSQFDIPIPKLLKYGQYNDLYYTLITYICGNDLGEVYHTLNDYQKQGIVKELVGIQEKVSALPSAIIDESDNYTFTSCINGMKNSIRKAQKNIIMNEIFDPAVCGIVAGFLSKFSDYFKNIEPTAFLDDISTKNVLIHNGKLAGIVDIDEMGYGDPLLVVGLTNMALLAMKADTKYIDYWLNEIEASAVQRKAVIFYTLLSCIDFMGERGRKFNNEKIVPVDYEEVKLLNSIFNNLCNLV